MAFGIYIHWPYCSRICPYCDFNVYRDRTVDTESWRQALGADLAWWAEETGPQELTSIYFGGGTPSLMPPDLVETIINQCITYWPAATGLEVTLEANPTDAEQTRFLDFSYAGINRLSLGVQSLHDSALQFLGRNHSAREARAAIDLGLEVFDRTTIDLIYARPDQTPEDWQRELVEALSTGVSHLSAYQLTVEQGTAFQHAVNRGDWFLPGDPVQADFYDLTQEICALKGLPAYEVSNHAVPGEESKHNLLYWQYQDYLGIGPGAHGRVNTQIGHTATEAIRNPAHYLAIPVKERFKQSVLTPEEQATEYLLMGLRLKSGVDLTRYHELAGAPLNSKNIASITGHGYANLQESALVLTTAGRLVLNQVVLELLR